MGRSVGLGWRKNRSTAVALGAALVFLLSPGSTAVEIGTCPALDLKDTVWNVMRRVYTGALDMAAAHALITSGAARGVPLMIWPPSGPAPLTVQVQFWLPDRVPDVVELDMDGDGQADELEESLQYTYRRPGQFRATAVASAGDGFRATYSTPVRVLSLAAFDAELQGRWMALKAAIRRGDLPGALECIHSEERRRYQEILPTHAPDKIERDFPPIRYEEREGGKARYRRAGTTGPPRASERDVEFGVDGDGVWRLSRY